MLCTSQLSKLTQNTVTNLLFFIIFFYLRLPEILPENCTIILSTTLHEKMNVKKNDIHHPERAYPRELAMSEDVQVHALIANVRSLSQYEPLSVHGSRASPILREAIRRKYWMLR